MAAAIPVIAAIAAPVAGTLLSSALAPDAPEQQQQLPSAPAPAAVPEVPTVSGAPDAAVEPVTDIEAARVRNLKRRQSAKQARLISLEEDTDESITLTKSLLGE